ncbi:hypothetical protein GY12_06700 [Micrococcus luteus]|nr:hypothetical protein GY12_06700 [Micrococcus luteus]
MLVLSSCLKMLRTDIGGNRESYGIGGAFAFIMSGMTGGQAMPPVDESKAEAAVAAVMAADPGLSSVAAPTSSDASSATLRYQDVEAELDLENGGRVVMGQVGRPGEAIGLELQGSGRPRTGVHRPSERNRHLRGTGG